MEKRCSTCNKYIPLSGCKLGVKATNYCLSTLDDGFQNEYNLWKPIQTDKKVNNPFDVQQGGTHYKIDGVMDVAEWTKKRGHCPYQANIVKYVDRHKRKNGIEDLRKAKQYLEFIAYTEYGENLE